MMLRQADEKAARVNGSALACIIYVRRCWAAGLLLLYSLMKFSIPPYSASLLLVTSLQLNALVWYYHD
jgi:hypothetical protein